MKHFALGAEYDERALFGGNRTGKTHAGTFEDTLHLTGLYPDWWEGRRFDRPVGGWVATDTAKNVRDILQEKFCGEPGVPSLFGTGMIPIDLFADNPTSKHGIANAYESVFVHHHTNGVYDGISSLAFKSPWSGPRHGLPPRRVRPHASRRSGCRSRWDRRSRARPS
jgi:hypothetical protein